MHTVPTPLLSGIQSPYDLRRLPIHDLTALCQELRLFLVNFSATQGGHLAANLGSVELTVALHYVFDTPADKLIWDVGHQAYCHKLLTGRQTDFYTLRRFNGLSGFPRRHESPYDAFGTGHSSTAVPAALGMATAARLRHQPQEHIAVVGDGACTAGLTFEALNQLSEQPAQVLVVLNDNAMSIDSNVGGLHRYLQTLSADSPRNGPNWFECLQLPYYGPVNGHNLAELIQVLTDLKAQPGPRLLHCRTVKGYGYAPAEADPIRWHAPARFEPVTGQFIKTAGPALRLPKYQDVFGHTLLELARANPDVVGVTPAMLSGCSMTIMQAELPGRVFDVGIAEQHAVTFSAGLATENMIVFCNIYSSFMQRAYDQVIHDVCLQKLPVIFCLDRAGLVGADGATHHGSYDLAYMRCVPNLVVASPMNEIELRHMLYTVQLPHNQQMGQAYVVRYPRGEGTSPHWRVPFAEIPIGKGRRLRTGTTGVALLSIGPIGNVVSQACDKLEEYGLAVAHYDMRFVKPLDLHLLADACERCSVLITVEDGCLPGGFGAAVLEALATLRYHRRVMRLGLPDQLVEHGEPHELYQAVGLSAAYITAIVQELIGETMLYHRYELTV